MSNAQNSKNNRRQLFLFQPAKILEEKEGGVQFPNPQIGPDSLCVHQATLLNQRPRISNGSQSRRSKIASAAPSVGKSFSNLELQRTNRIEWAWPLETNLSHFYILHKNDSRSQPGFARPGSPVLFLGGFISGRLPHQPQFFICWCWYFSLSRKPLPHRKQQEQN